MLRDITTSLHFQNNSTVQFIQYIALIAFHRANAQTVLFYFNIVNTKKCKYLGISSPILLIKYFSSDCGVSMCSNNIISSKWKNLLELETREIGEDQVGTEIGRPRPSKPDIQYSDCGLNTGPGDGDSTTFVAPHSASQTDTRITWII